MTDEQYLTLKLELIELTKRLDAGIIKREKLENETWWLRFWVNLLLSFQLLSVIVIVFNLINFGSNITILDVNLTNWSRRLEREKKT